MSINSILLDLFLGLAIDWVANNIYWTDMRLDSIEAAHIDGSNRSVILSEGLDAPRALALDPRSGFVLLILIDIIFEKTNFSSHGNHH